MIELNVVLKQYTPILHFQHKLSSEGATLRATELKPKLDKFLSNIENIPQEYFIGRTGDNTNNLKEKSNALDYKVFVCPIGENKKLDLFEFKTNNNQTKKINNYPSFFGNQGEENKKRDKQPLLCNHVKLSFTSLFPDLIEIIKENIIAFFAIHNFGNRQNKGFGSFYPEKVNNESVSTDPDHICTEILKSHNVAYKISFSDKIDHVQILKHINTFSQVMKSGVNSQGYERSFLFKYFNNMGICNEKRFNKNYINNKLGIKLKDLRNVGDERNLTGMNDTNYRYVRALLGVCENIKFGEQANIKYSHDEIKRFKSPITYKVINTMVYIIPEGIPVELYNKEFGFIYNKNKETSQKISTPKKDDFPNKNGFDLIEFLDSFVSYVNTWKDNQKNSLEALKLLKKDILDGTIIEKVKKNEVANL